MIFRLLIYRFFENYCYKWNIDGEAWNKPFTADDENLVLLDGIRTAVINPLMNLKKRVSGKNSATSICRMLYEYLEECGAEKSTGKMMGELIRLDRDYEAAELKRLWSCLIDIFDSISDVLGEKIITFTEISRIIKSMIGKLEYSVPPQTLDSVTAASARTARLSAPKIVFVIGANDGDFPNQVNVHGLFSENDKRRLSEHGIEISRSLSELVAAERLIVYKTLSSASEKVYLTYTLSDLSGKSKYPAQIIDSIIKMFNSENILLTKDNITLDYYAVTYHSAFYHYMQNVNENNKYTSSIKNVLMQEPEYKKRIEYVTRRSAMKQSYQIDSDVMQNLKSFKPLRVSATGVEDYNNCHFMYFCKHFMKLYRCEKVEIDGRISGEIIHKCLACMLRDIDKETFISMSQEELKSRIEKYVENYLNKELGGDFGKNKSFYFQLGKIIKNLLDILEHLQQELRTTSFTPVEFEAKISEPYSLILESDDGHKIDFGGTVDRVDTCIIDGKKYVRVIDYKSSEKKITPENLVGGINIQMLLYLFTITEKNSMFNDCIPAGVLYSYVYPKKDKEGKSAFKSTGLLLGQRKVLDAMECDITGEFIPVRLTNDKKKLDENKTSDILTTSSGMEWIKNYLYDMLRKMAESLLDGDVDALPQCIGDYAPCDYCPYTNICDNSALIRFNEPNTDLIDKIKKDKEILSKQLEETEE
ncbi:MAG: PD-(D/E)XK nuclease family protein [Muribaculaceae bacterium]|nr:PD-(D/E)XK nuclease family protein [Muribaculaceae bacterium]